MKCLITGSHGFIGRALTQALEQQECEGVGLPRDLLLRPEALAKFIRDINPELIFHLAAYGNKYSQRDETEIIRVNVMGTQNMLSASKNIKYKAFINIGSSSEYGQKDKPMKETDSLDTDTYYGAAKAATTMICRAFAKNYLKPVVTVRPFSLYGPGDTQEHFIPTAINAFSSGKVLSLAPGVHDWIYIDDFIRGIMLVATYANRLGGKAINIGSGLQTSNHAIISILRSIFMIPGNIHHVQRIRGYDTSISWVADISLMKALGWKPSIGIEEGLIKIINGLD